jgi:hypothetical protein
MANLVVSITGLAWPLHPNERTLIGAVGTAEKCHEQTHAPQQKDHLVGAAESKIPIVVSATKSGPQLFCDCPARPASYNST